MRGYAVATRYAADVKRVYKDLAAFPESGPPRSSLGANARIKIVYPFVIIYDADPDGVTILRILDGRREITERLISR
jgi:plasmid stabilization system protein ParE